MLVATTTALALRCPGCGKIQDRTLSLFSFSAQKSLCIACDCGEQILSISTKNRKVFFLQLSCLMCEGRHLYQYLIKEIWSTEVISLICEETNLEVGFIGPRKQVRKCMTNQERSLREMAEDLGFSDYFHSPEIMYEVLDRLHKIADSGHLSCHCGNTEIEVEIFQDRVELRCSVCGVLGVINAAARDDLDTIKNAGEIMLQPESLQVVGIGKERRHRRRSKK